MQQALLAGGGTAALGFDLVCSQNLELATWNSDIEPLTTNTPIIL
jgi:hypothetical protein